MLGPRPEPRIFQRPRAEKRMATPPAFPTLPAGEGHPRSPPSAPRPVSCWSWSISSDACALVSSGSRSESGLPACWSRVWRPGDRSSARPRWSIPRDASPDSGSGLADRYSSRQHLLTVSHLRTHVLSLAVYCTCQRRSGRFVHAWSRRALSPGTRGDSPARRGRIRFATASGAARFRRTRDRDGPAGLSRPGSRAGPGEIASLAPAR